MLMKKKDYLLRDTLKIKVCQNNAHTLEDLMATKYREKVLIPTFKHSKSFQQTW